jgi:hypothetical protein
MMTESILTEAIAGLREHPEDSVTNGPYFSSGDVEKDLFPNVATGSKLQRSLTRTGIHAVRDSGLLRLTELTGVGIQSVVNCDIFRDVWKNG